MRVATLLIAFVMIAGVHVATSQAIKSEWVQPYLSAPEYWEHLAVDPWRPALGPTTPFMDGTQVVGAALIPREVGAGERILLLAVYNVILDYGRPRGVITGDVWRLTFVGADSVGISLQLQKADLNISNAFQGCVSNGESETFLGRPDMRIVAVDACGDKLRWLAPTQLRFAFSATYAVGRSDNFIRLRFEATPTGVLRVFVDDDSRH